MHFTKSQIEEIARRLALITKRDSELPDAVIPLNDSERVPIIQYIPLVQDYENRLLSLADLRSLVLADKDQTSIACTLNVICNTDGATVAIKDADRTTYTGYYGEMVDVIITADGYDAWLGVVTLTQDHTLVVSLNKAGGSSPTPEVTSYKVIITTIPTDAVIVINAKTVASGEVVTFTAGTNVSITVSKNGYDTEVIPRFSLNDDFIKTVTLRESSTEPDDPFITFKEESITLDGETTATTQINSNISWVINVEDAPSEGEGGDEPASEDLTVDLPKNIIAYVGYDVDIY